MSAAPTIPWEQYQKLPPEQRRRPLTDAEYAALTKQQRIAAGLDEDEPGAPADFNGPVFPNPNHIQPQLDTDSAIPPTRLPEGVTFQHGNWSGTPRMDLSNPMAADVIPAMGREVGTNMSAQPIDFSKYEQGAPGGQQIDFSKYEQGKQSQATAPHDRFAQDRAVTEGWAENHPVLGPLARFLVSGGQNAANAITEAAPMLYHAVTDPTTPEEAGLGLDPKQRLIYRMGAKQAAEAGVDYASGKVTPQGALSVLPEALGTGVGQTAGGAVYGKAAELAPELAGAAAETVPKVVKAVRNVTPKQIAQGAGTATGAGLGHGALSVPGAYYGAKGAGALAESVLGKTRANAPIFGGEPEPVPELDATGENKPYAGEPKPKNEILDATAENKPFAGGMDEYTPVPKKAPGAAGSMAESVTAPAPRTIVRDPATGQPEFSDVVAAKQQTAAPAETKTTQPETLTAKPAPKGTPAETPGPAADDLLARLQQNAAKIQSEEKSAPGSADEDLTQQLQDSLAIVRARKAAQAAAKAPDGASGATITVPGQGEVPRFVYRARTPGEVGVPDTDVPAHATSDLNQAMKYAEPGQRGEGWGQVVQIDLSKLKPEDFTVRKFSGDTHWVKFKRPLTEDEVTPFAGQTAGAKQNVNPVQVGQ